MISRDEPVDDPALLRDALEALLDIAWEQPPPEADASLREQVEALDPVERERLLDGMVDTDRLRELIAEAGEDSDPALEIPAFEPDCMEKVDAVLTPLAELTAGPEARERVAALSDAQRSRLLVEAIGRRLPR